MGITLTQFRQSERQLSEEFDLQVIKETGFLKGLYTAEELNSENVRDRDAKIKFLEKLINIVGMEKSFIDSCTPE